VKERREWIFKETKEMGIRKYDSKHHKAVVYNKFNASIAQPSSQYLFHNISSTSALDNPNIFSSESQED
jgi:hypothetical protein